MEWCRKCSMLCPPRHRRKPSLSPGGHCRTRRPTGRRIDVITASELSNAPAHELDEILKRVAGLQLFRRSDSTSGHPTSQGVTLEHSAAMRRAIFLGIPVLIIWVLLR